jgi:hypothetical protein
MLFVVFNGIGYKVRDLMVLKTNDMESDLKKNLGIGCGKSRSP